ncbi:acyltransferase family protein [Polymorphospora rubra]|uniref:acyltransferase family protein n=1 Tax=Polymorphospora rubra TaxID=338584 RepID=UPI0033C1FE93
MRNRYLDLLRFLAIVRVVVYHSTGWAFLTVVFPAMSVMFALAGSLMAASLDRSGTAAVGRRLRRLLPSLWLLAALFVPAMLLTGLAVDWRLVLWAAPLSDPPSNGWGAQALSAVWYLRDLLWFVIVSPLALRLFRRFPLPTLLAPYALLVVDTFGLLPPENLVLRDFGLYFGAWLLGFAHHDGLLRRLSRRLLVGLSTVLVSTGLVWALTHPGPRGLDLNDIRLANGLVSAGFILVVLGLAPAAAAWVDRFTPVGRAVTVLNRRALTIYLWHLPAIIGLNGVAAVTGWQILRSGGGAGGVAFRIALVAALTAVAVALFGWVEDLAARRRPVLVPDGRPPAGPRPVADVGPAAGVAAAATVHGATEPVATRR